MYAKRMGRFMCAANEDVYSIVDLQVPSAFDLLRIEQGVDEPATPVKRNKPTVAIVRGEEFLVLSNMGPSTMGVFITENGDPVRGTLQWGSYPESICKFVGHFRRSQSNSCFCRFRLSICRSLASEPNDRNSHH